MTHATPEHSPALSLLVVDDQTAIREALATMLDLAADVTVTATAADGAQALDAVHRHRPDVVLMDLTMPGVGGVEATTRITRESPGTAVLVLTTFDDDESILGALQAGAIGYLTKDADRATILMAVRTAAAGHTVLAPDVQRRLLRLASATSATEHTSAPPPPGRGFDITGITARETEILRLIGEGLRNSEIAAALTISEATVKTHINNLFAKAGFRSRAEAVRYVLTAP